MNLAISNSLIATASITAAGLSLISLIVTIWIWSRNRDDQWRSDIKADLKKAEGEIHEIKENYAKTTDLSHIQAELTKGQQKIVDELAKVAHELGQLATHTQRNYRAVERLESQQMGTNN